MSLMARRLVVRYKQVIHWFQNKRSKDRKQSEGKHQPVQCNICRATFVSDSNLEIHKEEYHESEGTEKTKLSCSLSNCPAKFTNAELLATHKVSHELRDEIEDHKIDDCEDEEEQDDTSLLLKNVGILEAQYKDNNFPDSMDIGFIARRLSVDPLYVHMWFKERRSQQINTLTAEGVELSETQKDQSSQRVFSKECRHCVAAFISQVDLDAHEQMHQSPTAQVCSKCGAEFSNAVALETHWIRHGVFKGGASNHQQHQQKKDVIPHYATEEGRGPERGAKAYFTTSQLRVLDAHFMMNHFPGTVEVRLLAKRLGLRPRQVIHWFQNKRCKIRRIQKNKTHSSSTCSVCGAAFICESTLDNHTRLHQMDLQYNCKVCSAVFLSPILLETHMLHHLGILQKPNTLVDPLKQFDTTQITPIGKDKGKFLPHRIRGFDEETSQADLKIDESYMDGVEDMLEDEVEEAQLLDEMHERALVDAKMEGAIKDKDTQMNPNNTPDKSQSLDKKLSDNKTTNFI
ncbi:unnamed protein product, partial [Meganyctiphanes norvegica]